MKKWLIALCCILVAGVVAFVTLLNNSNSRIDTLNNDLGGLQAEYNSLKEKSEKDEKTIEELNQQVELLTAENGSLTAENGQLNESLEGLTRNLSSSEQKLQGMMYILTDGAEGSIDKLLSPYIRIFGDVPLNDPRFEAVGYVTEHQLMDPLGEEVFGAGEKALLGEFAEGLYRLGGKSGTRAEAVEALLKSEQARMAAQEAPAEEAAEIEAEEAPAEEAAEVEAEEAPAEEAAETEAEEAPTEEATEAEAEEAPAEEAAAAEAEEMPAEEASAEEAAEAEAEEVPAEEAAEAETEEAPVEEVAEAEAEEASAEDENTVLTKERILALAEAYCFENGKEVPEIVFPESETKEANRGDLAVALCTLAR